MGKSIKFTDNTHNTGIELRFNREEKEVMMDVTYDEQEAWYSFSSPAEIDDFIDELNIMKDKLSEALNVK